MAKKVGRKSKYNKSFIQQARKLTFLGATNKDLAEFFDVGETTIKRWREAHPEFEKAILEGKEEADSKVERSLYERATGYSHPETKVFCQNGEVTQVEITKHLPPDPTSMIFWLKNRKPDDWRDKREIGGDGGGPLVVELVSFADTNSA